ncbi:hypothetical protein SKAU_G00316860 [Synaphobranchus kaupii]|uniref:Uncharacterized protein n=1 Tax=Synaphobranchus kaupii TaxID=118154 RepID=A0A9Q1ESV8_SYNKA|nr:hypothetical protein SKAU_G00316860 [Synaphobranchus kaupii]
MVQRRSLFLQRVEKASDAPVYQALPNAFLKSQRTSPSLVWEMKAWHGPMVVRTARPSPPEQQLNLCLAHTCALWSQGSRHGGSHGLAGGPGKGSPPGQTVYYSSSRGGEAGLRGVWDGLPPGEAPGLEGMLIGAIPPEEKHPVPTGVLKATGLWLGGARAQERPTAERTPCFPTGVRHPHFLSAPAPRAALRFS